VIKGITTIRQTSDAKEYAFLVSIFATLGFEQSEEWQNGRSRGKYFRAPAGKLELVGGKEKLAADIWIEVSDLDTVSVLLKKQKARLVSDVAESDWDSRFLVVEPAQGIRFAFWQNNKVKEGAIEGGLNAEGMRFAIVVARWNSFITERLLQGSMDALRRSGCASEDIAVVRVPGSFEIPSQARTLAETSKYDAIITLGCLIRGETTHYEHIATEVTRGIGQSAQETGVPHTYGVLTCENLEQALDRAGLKSGNKGFEAAVSAIEMVSLKRKTAGRSGTSSVSSRTGKKTAARKKRR
jgi:6,7-dimethyl-8-ribityllumazine synthase